MILEVNTDLLNLGDINNNQLIFLSLILSKNQKLDQSARKLVSLIDDVEISDLIDKGYVTMIENSDTVTYSITEKANEVLTLKKNYFDLFYEMYPIYVIRKDGSKSYLRANVNKCRNMFNTKCGHNPATAEHLIRCLEYELAKRSREGSSGYMMTMWNWLTRNQWEAIEDEMNDESKATKAYGTEFV